jgi:hypothetical protein
MVYEVLTCTGISISTRHRLWDQNGPYTFAPGLEGNVVMMPQSRNIFIPLVAYIHSSGPPYDLTIYVWNTSENVNYSSLDVTNVTVTYENGESITNRRASTIWLLPDDGSDATSATKVLIEGLIDRQLPVKVTLVGTVTESNRKSVDFLIEAKFIPESARSLKTTWAALANM